MDSQVLLSVVICLAGVTIDRADCVAGGYLRRLDCAVSSRDIHAIATTEKSEKP